MVIVYYMWYSILWVGYTWLLYYTPALEEFEYFENKL